MHPSVFRKYAIDAVINVRSDIGAKYPQAKLANFVGYCDLMSTEVMDEMKFRAPYADIKFELIHGELKHCMRIDPKNWPIQHTMLKAVHNDSVLYIDPTCGQFQSIIEDCPSYYVGETAPWWFYPDEMNPAFRKDPIFKLLRKVDLEYQDSRISIIQWCQYAIWGTIAGWIRYKNERRKNL